MRKSGILMHISSLPDPYGIGTVGGKCAYEFVDFLQAAGQSYWQILPLSPTGYGDSPYQSFSTFAGNPYLIDLEALIEMGLLEREEVEMVNWGRGDRVDFGCLSDCRLTLLRRAYERYQPSDGFRAYVRENWDWLEDYGLFMALKEKFSGAEWLKWPKELALRDPAALAEMREELKGTMRFHYFLQYVFRSQWSDLRQYAHEKGIRIIGDVPIYVPLDSVDVWANPELFQLDAERRPTKVAGVPPDSFTADGQLWGNPLYDWEKMKAAGYDWWIRRLRVAGTMYDMIRLDHFRGFESYWAVPAGDKTAAGGSWQPGPAQDFVYAIQKALPELDFIAEDLGYVTPEVRQLQEDSGYPGMKVMQFAFDSRESGDYLPHTYPVNSVCYSGTHDNYTLVQWLDAAFPADVEMAKAYLGLNREEGIINGLIRGCMGSVSRLCVIQMQDYLELGAEARMNFPGTLSQDNWTWRAASDFAAPELATKIREITRRYGRL